MASKGEQRSGGPFSKGPLNRVNPIDSVAKSLVTSVAKPMAQKLASTEAGRSLLETIHNISGDALGKSPKRPDSPLTVLLKLARAATPASGTASTSKAEQPSGPKAASSYAEPGEPAVKWPAPFTAKTESPGTDPSS
jgi:hypothetical protein